MMLVIQEESLRQKADNKKSIAANALFWPVSFYYAVSEADKFFVRACLTRLYVVLPHSRMGCSTASL